MTQKAADEHYDVVILGAGSAGLSALTEATTHKARAVLIHDGPLGTTCARVGCMPSKAFLQVAHDYHHRHLFASEGILGAEALTVDLTSVMTRVRHLRDRFVADVLKGVEEKRDSILEGKARFIDVDRIRLGDRTFSFEHAIVATGSRPHVPPDWQHLGERLLTTDTFFEQATLPKSIAVVGLGAIGVELGQAMARLGVEVHGYDKSRSIASCDDGDVCSTLASLLKAEMTVELGVDVELTLVGEKVRVKSPRAERTVDAVLASMGRRPQIEGLSLDMAGVKFTPRGQAELDPATLRARGSRVFIVGDANGERPVLHEASEMGRRAVRTALGHASVPRFVPFRIGFCDPNVANVGVSGASLPKDGHVVGTCRLEGYGRAILLGKDAGVVRIYAEKGTGKILGANIVAPQGEHLGHLVALAVQNGLTVNDVLQTPFYHPTLEEAVQDALRDCLRQL